jgi:c-di-GMP-binding flagellar brake protein YcgR
MLQSLFGFKRDANAIVDLSNQQAFHYLQRAHQQREFVEVLLPGDDTIYQSLLLELDNEEKTILIDEFFPGTAFVAPGQVLRLSIRQKGGRSLKFQSRVLETYHYDDAPLYVIAMPDFIDYDQRRNAFRLPVDSALAVDVDFTAPDQKIYCGRIGDISATGLSLHLPKAPECELLYGNRLENVNFEFAQITISSDLTIRNVPHKIEPDASVRIGAEFVNLSASQAKDLELTILQIQRERLRRGEDMRERLIN